jgi:hypothetical protein
MYANVILVVVLKHIVILAVDIQVVAHADIVVFPHVVLLKKNMD